MDPQSFLKKYGGDAGALFNATEVARAGKPGADPDMLALAPDDLVALNRFAQSADVPATALLAAPYEGLKLAEQKTGIPVLSGASRVANAVGIPVSAPDATTSPASGKNVLASLRGAGSAFLRGLGVG